MLSGVIKNSLGLFSLFAEFLREGDKNRVGELTLTHPPNPLHLPRLHPPPLFPPHARPHLHPLPLPAPFPRRTNSHKIRTKRETVRGNNLAITTKFVQNEKLQPFIMHVKHLYGKNIGFEFDNFPRFLDKSCIRITELYITSRITNAVSKYCITVH